MFKMASSPHTHSGAMTPRVMLWVIMALLPALFAQLYFFGFGVMWQCFIALPLTALLEIFVARLRQKPRFFYLSDGSGLLTAFILAMAIPPYAPWWLIIIGIITAILLAKHLYGGLGQNLFNPAMVGYVLLLVSFPLAMSSWAVPQSLLAEPLSFMDSASLVFFGETLKGQDLFQLTASIDGLTQATPLDSWRTIVSKGEDPLLLTQTSPLFMSLIGTSWGVGKGWFMVNLAFFVGGLALIFKGIIHWHIPLSILVIFSLLCLLSSFSDNNPTPIWQLFSGSVMFGAFFIATDPVTAPLTAKGRWIFGAMVGFLLYLIRYHGGYPDGVAFAVLLSNLCVPLIDYYTRPRTTERLTHKKATSARVKAFLAE